MATKFWHKVSSQIPLHLLSIGDRGHDPCSVHKAWHQVHTWPHSVKSEEIKQATKVKTGLWLISKQTSPNSQPRQSALEVLLALKDWETRKQCSRILPSWEKMSRWGLEINYLSMKLSFSSKIHCPQRSVIKEKYWWVRFESLLCTRHKCNYLQPLNDQILSTNFRQVSLSSFIMGRDWNKRLSNLWRLPSSSSTIDPWSQQPVKLELQKFGVKRGDEPRGVKGPWRTVG